MSIVVTLAKRCAAVVTAAASLCLLFLMCIVIVDVVARAINPEWRILGTLDMVEFSLDWMLYLSIAAALFANQIISVDLVDAIDKRGWLKIVGLVALFIIISIMAWQTIRPALNVLEWGETTFDLGLPKFWYWVAIWVGLGLSIVAVVFNLTAQLMRKQLIRK